MEDGTCSSCAPDGSRESVKCQVRQEACVPSWNNQLHAAIQCHETHQHTIVLVHLFPLQLCNMHTDAYTYTHRMALDL